MPEREKNNEVSSLYLNPSRIWMRREQRLKLTAMKSSRGKTTRRSIRNFRDLTTRNAARGKLHKAVRLATIGNFAAMHHATPEIVSFYRDGRC